MQAFAVSYSRYALAFAVVVYTGLAYFSLIFPRPVRRVLEIFQRLCIMAFCAMSFLTLAILQKRTRLFAFGLVLAAVIFAGALVYRRLYRFANMQMFNNICMFLSIGLTMICRINHGKCLRQFLIACAGLVFLILIPLIRDRFDFLQQFCYFYAIIGIAALAGVLVLGSLTNGSKLNITLAGITVQPSEFVKILFLLFLAGALCEPLTKLQLILLSMTAAAHVGILVLSRDLGSALIFYVTYISLLFLASGKWKYLLIGLGLGAAGAIACYFLFSHVHMRVQVFLDPWAYIEGGSYQITQSLFALSYGGFFGAGLTQGMPASIPFVESDFIFSAIVEEMGLVTGICVILLCLHVFMDFMQLASSFISRYYQLFVFGSATAYLFQTFLTIGGEVNFIPLTGVTLPLVSYGGSSVLSTMIMMGIVGAVFMMQSEQLERFRERYEMEQAVMTPQYERESTPFNRRDPRAGRYEDVPEERDTAVAIGVPYYDPEDEMIRPKRFDF